MASSMLTPETTAAASVVDTNIEEVVNSSLRSCANDPNYAIICAFLQKFANDLGLNVPNFKHLQEWLTRTDEVAPQLRDMQIKLLRKTRKTVHEKSWETALSKFCFTYSAQDAWEIERFGYKNAGIKIKLRILRELLESQFERNGKFRAKILTQTADSLRSKPLGRDRLGHAYWVTQDQDCNLRIYQEHLDEDTWQVVATNREEFVNLITRLKGNEAILPSSNIGVVDEDTSSSNSCSEVNEKPPPPEERDDSLEDDLKVPKLSIKLVSGINPNNNEGKGEEDLAAEEDERCKKINGKEGDSCGEEFEEVEEEYEEEDETDDEEDGAETPEPQKCIKTVKPLLISQNKIRNTSSNTSVIARKRTIEEVDSTSPPVDEKHNQATNVKKTRPTLLDSKQVGKISKYEDGNVDGEENYASSTDEDGIFEEEVEEEDIDSAAAEEDENEEKQIEDFDDDDDNNSEVGEEITDPVFRIEGEGSGKDCELGNLWGDMDKLFEDESHDVSEVLGEIIFCVQGDGAGNECMVGNVQPDAEKLPEDTTLLKTTDVNTNNGKMADSQEIPISVDTREKIEAKNETTNNKNIDEKETDIKEILKSGSSSRILEKVDNPTNGEKVSKQCSSSNSSSDSKAKDAKINTGGLEKNSFQIPQKADQGTPSVEANKDSECKKPLSDLIKGSSGHNNGGKMSALETLKKELRESKQKSLEQKAATSSKLGDPATNILKTNSTTWNRKRRLEGFTSQQSFSGRTQNSESEIDFNSENTEEFCNEQDDMEMDEQDIGGKRLKMRPKQNNTELRKKIEAQKAAGNDETTSSSGGEEESRRRRKIISPKKHSELLRKTNETEKITIALTDHSLKPNGQSGEGQDIKVEPQIDVSVPQQPSTSQTKEGTNLKHKATLSEIIEKKLKKVPAEDVRETSSPPPEVALSKPFSPPKKYPITKPLKKNLLTQMRQEESEEETIPRKRTLSEEHSSSSTIDSKSTICIIKSDKQRITPERQRKRRSSEETVKSSIPEEPGIKKENTVSDDDNSNKQEDLNTDIQNELVHYPKKESEIKEEPEEETQTKDLSRCSGRRGVSGVSVESQTAKRTRGCPKTLPKDNIAPKIGSEDKDISENVKSENDEKCSPTKDSNTVCVETKDNIIKTPAKKAEPVKTEIKSTIKGTRKKRDVDTKNIIEANDTETPVRQSRRIAQQKIREEAERRKLEEIALRTMKQELKKKKKAEKQTDPTVVPPSESSSESEESDLEKKRKAQKKKYPGKNGNWSSGSEEQEEPDEEEEEEQHRYETDPGSPLFKSDHEFSPESDLEDDTQVVPMKRARTARKEDAADSEPDEEEACQKCNKSDHPEWILLCDNCDKGYHCSCLSPVLFYIPEGNWYCPPCQQEQLIAALEDQLKELDELVERKKIEAEEEKRLAEEEKARKEEEDKMLKDSKKGNKPIQRRSQTTSDEENSHGSGKSDGSSDQTDDSQSKKKSIKSTKSKRYKKNERENRYEKRHKSSRKTRSRGNNRASVSCDSNLSDSSSKSNSTSSSTYSDSDNEPIYKLRKRRQINVSYRLNEYDDLINSALKKEMDEAAGAGNLGRGKDITTIIEADKEEKARQKQVDEINNQLECPTKSSKPNEKHGCSSPKKSSDSLEDNVKKADKSDSDDEVLCRKPRQRQSLKKKSRKLTTLDISSEDDNGSDEDFKGSSVDDDDEEDTSISASSNSDSSLEIYKRKGKSKRKQRKAARRAFRQRRKDRKFIVDESDEDEDVQRPKSKKKRKVESDYTESEIDDDDVSELSENVDSADLCDDSSTEASDGAWRPNKRKKSKKSNTPASSKEVSKKNQQPKKNKKVQYSDDDVTESDEDIDDEDEPLGVGGGKQPRSQPLKTTPKGVKSKGKSKPGCTSKTKKKNSSDDCQSFSDSEDSTRRTRGRRYAYIEDFEDDSSDGGIKPGVQRPDTPPEEREKFIKRQEEIKRMLAEKNAEGAKLAATPRLTPIKSESDKDKRSPSKSGTDSLSTVPLSVIRQAKVLDIDYLQRRGENLDDLSNDVDDVGDDFDDADLPDDLPEDMDEDAIARMVEEEEEFNAVAARELPAPDEVLRTSSVPIKPKPKETEKVVPVQTPTFQAVIQHSPLQTSTSGLQEPVRKRLPMPTMHPPLLRHQLFTQDSLNTAAHQITQRLTAPPASQLLQTALSAPLNVSQHRAYPPPPQSLINRLPQNLTTSTSGTSPIGPCKAASSADNATSAINLETQDKSPLKNKEPEVKPRGRRKKITPLRDTLQKQQTAAAVAAAASASTAANTAVKIRDLIASSTSSVIKPGPPSKVPMQASVITSLHHPSRFQSSPQVTMPTTTVYPGSEDFFRHTGVRLPPPNTQRHRGPSQLPTSLLASHQNMRPSYGPPPPLKGSIEAPTSSGNSTNIRVPSTHMTQYAGAGPSTPRHSGSHINLYGSSIYGNPNFGPRGSLRPPPIHSSQYPAGSRAYPPYGFYPPPPPLTTPPPQTPRAAVQQPTSVIVSNTSNIPSKISGPSAPPAQSAAGSSDIDSKPISVKTEFNIKSNPSKTIVPGAAKSSPESCKKLTTLETYTPSEAATNLAIPLAGDLGRSKSPPGLQANISEDSLPTTTENHPATTEPQPDTEGPASEFSGLVSYFSSQHDDYNT